MTLLTLEVEKLSGVFPQKAELFIMIGFPPKGWDIAPPKSAEFSTK